METDQQSILNSLMDKGPEGFSAYLRRFEDDPQLSSGLSMLVIYGHSASIAKKQGNLDWAEIAVRAAELEALTSTNEIGRHDSRWMAMQLRSWFISKMGSRSDHLVLDKEIVLRWVTEGLTLSVQAARDKAARIGERLARVKDSSDPKEMQRVGDDLRQLRRIKHCLNVAKVLVDCGEHVSDPVLDEWLEIREQLP
jgi:hypothetical protein